MKSLASLAATLVLATTAAAQTCLSTPTPERGLDLWLGDDDHRIVFLPFAFPFAGQSVAQIAVCSNGFVWLGRPPLVNPNDFSDSEAELRTGPPRIALCWDDWNPAAGGEVRYYGGARQVSVVWRDVPAFADPAVRANMELVLSAGGQIDLHYAADMGQPTSSVTVGLSRGFGAAPAPVDWSSLPIVESANAHEHFASGFDLGGTTTSLIPTTPADFGSAHLPLPVCRPGVEPPVLASAVRYGTACPPALIHLHAGSGPHLGGGFDLLLDVPPATGFAATLVGTGPTDVDLGPLGAPGCRQLATPDLLLFAVPQLGRSWLQLPVPADPALAALRLYSQGLVPAPGSNALGIAVSNGLQATVGQ